MRLQLGVALSALAMAAPTVASADAAVSRKVVVNVGADAVGRSCVARRVFGDRLAGERHDRAYDLICGGGEAGAVGRLYLFATSDVDAALQRWSAAAAAECAGGAPQVWTPSDFVVRVSTLCAGEAAGGEGGAPGRTALYQAAVVAQGRLYAGDALPAAAPALERAMRVFSGLEPEPAAGAQAGPRSALLESLQAALGEEMSGGGFADFATLRRLAYESNALWLFSAAERQFADAARMHAALWPRDFGGRADLQAERALNLANQRRFAEAEKVLEDARNNAVRGDDPYALAKSSSYAALVSLNAGELEQAGERVREARARIADWRRRGGAADRARDEASGAVPVEVRVAMLEAQMARTEALVLRRSDPARARAALADAAQQATRLDRRAAAWLHAVIAQDLAAMEVSAGRPAEGARLLRAALEDYRRGASRTRIEANLLMDLGDAERAAGAREAALAHFRDAFALYREQPENRGVGSERALVYLSALMEGGVAGAELFDAFETVTSPAVAQTAAATAARLQAGEGGEAIRAWQDGDRALRRVIARQAAMSQDAPAAEREAVEADVARLRAQVFDQRRALDAQFPNFGVVTLQPVSLDELQGALGPGERVVRLVIGARSGAGLIVDRDGVRAFPIALGESEVTALVNQIKGTVRNPEKTFDAAASRALFDGLFGAVREDILASGAPPRLVIEATGALSSLPFGILLTGAGEGADTPWLARQRALIAAPSMRSFVLARSAGPSAGTRPFVGFGDFTPLGRETGDLVRSVVAARRLPPSCIPALEAALAKMPPLPGTARELETVRRTMGAPSDAVLTRAQFTDGEVLQSDVVDDARVVMFSTHGLFAADFPEARGCLPEAALLTSAVNGAPGLFLDSAQVLDLKLDADLVVLSACDTGNPQSVAPGETGLPSGGDAMSGLARSFFYAGARSVLVSHWVLPDEDTVAMMAAFFERIAAGVPAPEALQAAQMAQIAAGADDPLQWAAFVVVGAPPAVGMVRNAPTAGLAAGR